MRAARDYSRLLLLAEELQAFTGYLGSMDMKERHQFQTQFDAERRKLAYELLKAEHRNGLAASVVADMDRIAETSTEHSPGAIAEAREGLLAEIDRMSGSGPAMRFLLRWGSVALGLVGLCIYLYFTLRTR